MLLFCVATVLLGYAVPPAIGEVRTATLMQHNLSFALETGICADGLYRYFSTYDGILSYALRDPNYDGYSDEVRPDTATSTIYRSDYNISSSYSGPLSGFGSIRLDLPGTDIDEDGLPDFLDFNRAVNISISGSGTEYFVGLGTNIYNISGRMTRLAGRDDGEYIIQSSRGAIVNGHFEIRGCSGTVHYDTESSALEVTARSFDGLDDVDITTTYEVLSANTILVNGFEVEQFYGTLSVSNFTLTRSGNTYIGRAILADGEPRTSWADYSLWHLKITDNNDSDGDGIPDFSDPPVQPPIIVGNPVSQEVVAGDSVGFNVTAEGPLPLRYQWRRNQANVAGATNATYAIPSVTTNHAGNYTVVVTNLRGSVTSAVATLTVLVPPRITTQPSGRVVWPGSNVTFAVTAAGTAPLYYQWRKDGDNMNEATNAILPLLNVMPEDAGIYSVVVGNAAGVITSSNAVLTVKVRPSIEVQPTDGIFAAGTTVTLTVEASGTLPLSYRWRRNGSNLSNVGNVLGATSNVLTLSAVTTNNSGNYTVVVTNIAGSLTSSVANVAVMVLPAITSHPTNRTVLAGTNVTFRVAATGTAPLSYQWRKDAIDLANGSRVSGATSNIMTLTGITVIDAGAYSVAVANAVGIMTSYDAILTVNQRPLIVAQPMSATVVPGGNAAFAVEAVGTSPLSYRWRRNGVTLTNAPSILGATSNLLAILNVTTNSQGSYSVVVTNNFGSMTSSLATLTTIARPTTLPLIRGTNGTMVLSGIGGAGASYVVQVTTNLTPTVLWLPLSTNTADTNGLWQFIDTNAILQPSRFYRSRTP